MGEDSTGREKTMRVIDGGVGGMRGKELADKGELGEVLGEVRLDREVFLFM